MESERRGEREGIEGVTTSGCKGDRAGTHRVTGMATGTGRDGMGRRLGEMGGEGDWDGMEDGRGERRKETGRNRGMNEVERGGKGTARVRIGREIETWAYMLYIVDG